MSNNSGCFFLRLTIWRSVIKNGGVIIKSGYIRNY